MLHISVRLGFFGFWGENPPTDSPFIGFGGGDPPLIVIGIKLAGSRVKSDGLDESQFLLDTPTFMSHANTYNTSNSDKIVIELCRNYAKT